MKENNRGSMIILTVIGIATLLIAVMGATFAYFTATIEYKSTPTTVVVQSSTMIVEFDSVNELDYTGAIPGRPETDYDLFKDNKLRFTLTSHPNLVSETTYDVYLVIDKSEFVKNPENPSATDELVYVTSQYDRTVTEQARNNGSIGKAGIANYINTIDGVEYNSEKLTITKTDKATNTEVKEEVMVGLIPSNISYADDVTEEDKIRIKVGSGTLASHNSSDAWQVEIWLKETQGDQNYNQGRNMQAHIDIVVTGEGYASNETVTTTTQATP